MRDVLSWSFPLGQPFGIAIRVHFLLPVAMIGLVGRALVDKDYPAGAWQDAMMLVGLLFFIILLHEFGHVIAARVVDGESDEILMWPLGGLAYARSLPNTPVAHFVFALGGPLVNIVLALILGLALYYGFESSAPLSPRWDPFRYNSESPAIRPWAWTEPAEVVLETRYAVILLMRAFFVNWILLLFNTVLIGIPFDGGRMLQAALWPRMGYYQATKFAIYAGFAVMVLVGLYSIWYREPMMAFLAVFIFVACAQEYEMLENAHEDSLFGYDFSQGYTSLEKEEAAPPPPKARKQNFIQRWLAQRAAKKAQQDQEERAADDRRMDELLEKIQKHGKSSLTDEEQRFLKRVSDRYKNKSD